MNDKDWLNRLVVFRGPLTLGQSLFKDKGAAVYQGRIREVFRENGLLFAKAEAIFEKRMPVDFHNTNPDPNWTAEQYDRRKHHRAIFRVSRPLYTGWSKADNQQFLIKQSQNNWKPHKF